MTRLFQSRRLNAEMKSWDQLEAKIKKAMNIAKGHRYSAPYIKRREALENTQAFTAAMKELHDSFRKQK